MPHIIACCPMWQHADLRGSRPSDVDTVLPRPNTRFPVMHPCVALHFNPKIICLPGSQRRPDAQPHPGRPSRPHACATVPSSTLPLPNCEDLQSLSSTDCILRDRRNTEFIPYRHPMQSPAQARHVPHARCLSPCRQNLRALGIARASTVAGAEVAAEAQPRRHTPAQHQHLQRPWEQRIGKFRSTGSLYLSIGGGRSRKPCFASKCTVRNWALHAGLNRLGCI